MHMSAKAVRTVPLPVGTAGKDAPLSGVVLMLPPTTPPNGHGTVRCAYSSGGVISTWLGYTNAVLVSGITLHTREACAEPPGRIITSECASATRARWVGSRLPWLSSRPRREQPGIRRRSRRQNLAAWILDEEPTYSLCPPLFLRRASHHRV